MKKCLLALKVACSNTLNRWTAAHSDVAGLCLQPFSSHGDINVVLGKSKFWLRSLWNMGACRLESRSLIPHSCQGAPCPAHMVPKAPPSYLYSAALPWDAAKA